MAIEDLLISALGRVKNCGRMHLHAQILLRIKNPYSRSTVSQLNAVVVKLYWILAKQQRTWKVAREGYQYLLLQLLW